MAIAQKDTFLVTLRHTTKASLANVHAARELRHMQRVARQEDAAFKALGLNIDILNAASATRAEGDSTTNSGQQLPVTTNADRMNGGKGVGSDGTMGDTVDGEGTDEVAVPVAMNEHTNLVIDRPAATNEVSHVGDDDGAEVQAVDSSSDGGSKSGEESEVSVAEKDEARTCGWILDEVDHEVSDVDEATDIASRRSQGTSLDLSVDETGDSKDGIVAGSCQYDSDSKSAMAEEGEKEKGNEMVDNPTNDPTIKNGIHQSDVHENAENCEIETESQAAARATLSLKSNAQSEVSRALAAAEAVKAAAARVYRKVV